jgi:hypothetical protein
MKLICTFLLVSTLYCPPGALAQDGTWDRWTIEPHLSLGKLLPGTMIDRQSADFITWYSPSPMVGITRYQYAGTAIGFGVRAFPEGTPWLAVILGGGITWFYRPGASPVYTIMPDAANGVGAQIAPDDFTVYPITLGAQVVYPWRKRSDFILFAGAEATANFVSGDLPMDQAVKPGFGFEGGFAVKVFELGIRYQTFSDIRNLGVYLAFRLHPFDVDFSSEDRER